MPPTRSLADYLAAKVIRHARNIKTLNEDKIWCLDCKILPIEPVTGRCGHTRCKLCIKRNGACPCGAMRPQNLRSNIVVREIVGKIMSRSSHTRLQRSSPVSSLSCDNAQPTLIPTCSSGRTRRYLQLSRLHRKPPKQHCIQTWHKDLKLRKMLASPQMRYEYSRQLVSSGRLRDAAGHLAIVVASSDSAAKMARELLIQVIATLSVSCNPSRLTRSLYQCVRQQEITSWVEPRGLECPVCYSVMNRPVTTTCGHTFCRCCIKQTLLNRHICPLCASSLHDFHVTQTEDTEFVSAIVGSINPDFIPIFACTVAFPDIPCPLMIFKTDFRNVIRSLLASGSRLFGMLASNEAYSNCGTIVEVRDCVMFEDGSSIISTVGRSRFRVIEKVIIDGCPYARVQEHEDITPISPDALFDLQLLARQISSRVQRWLPSMDDVLRTDITTCFGGFPEMNLEGDWWDNPNGPSWLWWLVAILPLRSEIQVLMLSTRHLMKRMMAVHRTLDAIEFSTYVYRIP